MKEEKEVKCSEEERRDFLRKSAYAACATPVITGMLVEKASAAKSWNSGAGEITEPGGVPGGAPLGPNPGQGVDDKPSP